MKRRGETTRRAVLRAAEEVFAERGYAGARMDDVAERVGIRRASMVYYFRNKLHLYESLLDDLFNDLVGRYEAVLAGEGTVAERMLRCIDVWAAQVEERPGLLRITLWELARARASKRVMLASRVGPIVRVISEAVRAGQREGVFRNVDPIRFVLAVAGTTAFLSLGTVLVEDTPELRPGGLGTELRSWVARVLFVD